jgi:hypothetical protein
MSHRSRLAGFIIDCRSDDFPERSDAPNVW